MSGKKVICDCGHEGEIVIGTFARCVVKGCDGKPAPRSPAPKGPPVCCDMQMSEFALYGGHGWHCWKCGKLRS